MCLSARSRVPASLLESGQSDLDMQVKDMRTQGKMVHFTESARSEGWTGLGWTGRRDGMGEREHASVATRKSGRL